MNTYQKSLFALVTGFLTAGLLMGFLSGALAVNARDNDHPSRGHGEEHEHVTVKVHGDNSGRGENSQHGGEGFLSQRGRPIIDNDNDDEDRNQNVPGTSLRINPEGKFVMKDAPVTEVSLPNFKANVDGVIFSLKLAPNAVIEPAGSVTSSVSPTTQIAVNDRVDVEGTIAKDTGLVTVSELRDRTTGGNLVPGSQADLQKKVDELFKQFQSLRNQFFQLFGR